MSGNGANGRIIGGIFLMGLGAILLAGRVMEVNLWRWVWPLIVIAFGALFFLGMATGGRESSGAAVPGCVITGIGLILLYQNTFNHWETWAYAWTLIPVAVGAGLIIHGKRSGLDEVRHAGSFLVGLGLVLFLVFGSFFELIIGLSGAKNGGLFWPLLLIGLGLYIALRRVSHGRVGDPAVVTRHGALAPENDAETGGGM